MINSLWTLFACLLRAGEDATETKERAVPLWHAAGQAFAPRSPALINQNIMISLFLALLIGYGQTGVRLDAYLPTQQRVVMGRIAGVGDEVVIVTQGRLFVGESTRLAIARNRVYIEAEGQQDGIPAIALIECEDNEKQDRAQIAVLQEIGEGDFGFPGRPLPCYPVRQGGDAVEIFGRGK